MTTGSNSDERGTGGETHNHLSGHVNGPVFQGRNFENVNIGAPFPKEVAAYYRNMQQRLSEQEQREEEERQWLRGNLLTERPKIIFRIAVSIFLICFGVDATWGDSSHIVRIFGAAALIFGTRMAIRASRELRVNREHVKELEE